MLTMRARVVGSEPLDAQLLLGASCQGRRARRDREPGHSPRRIGHGPIVVAAKVGRSCGWRDMRMHSAGHLWEETEVLALLVRTGSAGPACWTRRHGARGRRAARRVDAGSLRPTCAPAAAAP
eukprot:2648023-Rhodomonas_salina.2